MNKIKLFLILLVLNFIQLAGAQSDRGYVEIEELSSAWGQDLNNPQEFEKMLLWTELVFKHSVVSAISAYEEVSSALGFETMGRVEKISIPLSLGAAFAAGMIGSEIIRRRSLAQASALNHITALNQVSRYRDAVTNISKTDLEKRIKIARLRKTTALRQAASRDLAAFQSPSVKPLSFFQRYAAPIKVFGFVSIFTGGASAAYAYASSDTADIQFENAQEMKSLQEEFTADIEWLSSTLGLSK